MRGKEVRGPPGDRDMQADYPVSPLRVRFPVTRDIVMFSSFWSGAGVTPKCQVGLAF